MINTQDKMAPKYLQVANGIKKIILSQGLSDDSALPSHSELVKRFDVSQGTIRQSLGFLAKTGWVRSQRGKGVFVNTIPACERREFLGNGAVGLLVVGGGLDTIVRRMIIDEVACVVGGLGKDMRIQNIQPDSTDFSQLKNFLTEIDSVALYGNVSKELILLLKQHNIRIAVIGHVPSDGAELEGVAYFRADMVMAGRLAGTVLNAYGHKKISLVIKSASSYSEFIQKGLCGACQSGGLELPAIYRCEDMEDLQSVAAELSSRPDMTGLVIDGGSCSRGLLDIFSGSGIKVPQDKSMMVIADGHVAEVQPSRFSKIYPYSCIDVRLQAVTHEALSWLMSGAEHSVVKFIAPDVRMGNTLELCS